MRILIAIALLSLALPSSAAVLVVDTSSDSAGLNTCSDAVPGDCSLRGAIARANTNGEADTIEFDIPMSDPGCNADTGICRIVVNGNSPITITQPLTINGYTQAGAQPNTIPAPGAHNAQLKIEITADPPVCLSCTLFSTSNTLLELRGLSMFQAPGAILGGINSSHVIRGNWFNVQADGEVPDLTSAGFVLRYQSFNRNFEIGGPNPADRNVFAGSGVDQDGAPGGGTNALRVQSAADHTPTLLVQGNLFGLLPDGITALPFRDPLMIGTGDNSSQTPDIRILDNRFVRPPRNFSGFSGGALQFSASIPMDAPAFIQGNVFGLGVDGSRIGVQREHILVSSLGNSAHFARIQVGGLGPNEGNVFAAGIRIGTPGGGLPGSAILLPTGQVSTFIEFVGNTMLGNDGFGLDMPPIGSRRLNDPGDADSGANNLQNHPRISGFSVSGGEFDVTYLVDSHPDNSSYPLRMDFYRAFGDEGEVLLDSDVYEAADAQSSRSVTLSVPPGVTLTEDDVLVAIATDAEGRSSEFSFDTLTLEVEDFPNPHPAGLPITVQAVATATSGPFKPNGVVRVSMNTAPPVSCLIELEPTPTALTSAGSCELIPTQAGNLVITATYDSFAGAFASTTGGDVVETTPHQVTEPGPEQVSFRSCRTIGLEGRDLPVLIERPSGGISFAEVDLVHEAGSATPGEDYTPPANQTLSWAPGDFAAKLIVIPIHSDGLTEPVETFRLRLQNPIGTSIVPHGLLEVRILDGDDQGFMDGFEGDCPE